MLPKWQERPAPRRATKGCLLKIGLSTFPTDYSMTPAALALAAEERGFESVFFPDHTHVPVKLTSPFPDGGEVPIAYKHGIDPLVAMAAAAAVTSRIRLGTAVCLVVQRDPIILAKQVASIDHFSNGRVELGVGAGWSAEEMANHGTEFSTRWTLLRERVEAMREIWTKEEAEYSGSLVSFGPIWCWPKPKQRPAPPVLIGGSGPKTLERVVRYGDGWIPPLAWVGDLAERIATLRRLTAEAGRGPLPVTVMGVKGRPELIRELEGIGVSRVVISLPAAGRDEILPRLDHYTRLL
jgi:probable F420-dependent oxidoreductase